MGAAPRVGSRAARARGARAAAAAQGTPSAASLRASAGKLTGSLGRAVCSPKAHASCKRRRARVAGERCVRGWGIAADGRHGPDRRLCAIVGLQFACRARALPQPELGRCGGRALPGGSRAGGCKCSSTLHRAACQAPLRAKAGPGQRGKQSAWRSGPRGQFAGWRRNAKQSSSQGRIRR